MDCKSSKSLSSEYLEGTLSPERKMELEEHLERCESCRKVFHRLSVLLSLEFYLGRYKVSPEFQENLFGRIREFERSQSHPSESGSIWKVLQTRWVYGFASLLFASLLLLSVFTLWKRGGRIYGRAESSLRIPEKEVFVLEPYSYWGEGPQSSEDLSKNAMGEALFLLDQRTAGGDTLFYSLPLYSGEIRLVSY